MLSNQSISRFDRWTELISAIILAPATVCTAWCSFQAARWGGEQTTHFMEASAANVTAAKLVNKATQITTVNVGLFIEWAAAVSQGDQALADFLYQRFTPDLKTAMDAWVATDPLNNADAPATPLVMPEYTLQAYEESDRLTQEAEELFEQASQENEISDQYVLLTVIFASVLFFAGVSGKFESQLVDLAMLVFAIIIFGIGLVILFTYPIH